VAYTIVAWLLIQVADILLDAFETPGWIFRLLIILLAIGFPVSLVISWFFEFTPRGLMRESTIEPDMARKRVFRGSVNVVIMSILVSALALFAVDRFWLRSGSAPGPSTESDNNRTIAVLPFINRSSLEEDRYFAEGIHDDLLTTLAKIDSLRVTSRTSVMRYSDGNTSIPEIGQELGVASVLEGGVQRAGQQVRINAQLIDVETDEHLWAETFDHEITTDNLFAIQSEITRAIAGALRAQLSKEEVQRLETSPTDSLEAYDAYLRGRSALLDRRRPAMQQAVENFKTSTSLDPEFAAAWAGLCEAWLRSYAVRSDPVHFEAARSACDQALAIDKQAVEVHVALGRLYRHHGDYDQAEAEQRQALAMDPDNTGGLIELGLVLALLNQNDEAESTLLLALSLQPADWQTHDALYYFYSNHDRRTGYLDRSVKYAMRVVELEPDVASAWNNLGTAYHALQQYDAARTAWDRALELEPTRTGYTNRGLHYYYDGRFDDSAEMQLKAVELAPNDHRAWGRLAESYRQMGGEDEKSLEAYDTAIRLAEEQLGINEKDWRTRAMLAVYLAYTAQNSLALQQVETALQQTGRNPETLLYAALIYNETGDLESTFTAMEEAVAADDSYRWYFANEPDLKVLHSDLRFQKIIAD